MPDIHNTRVLILASDGFEQLELTVPRDELRKAGARVDVATPTGSAIRGWDKTDWGETAPADLKIEGAKVDDYDVLVLPGGVINPDKRVSFARLPMPAELRLLLHHKYA